MDTQSKLDEWNTVKKGIDEQENRKKVEAQRIYWVSIGQNVGGEVYGKSEIFTRPVLVVKAFFNHTFLGVPLTSKVRNKRSKFSHKFTDSKGKVLGAQRGDLIVQVKIAPSSEYEREGDDLFKRCDVSLKTALFGGSIKVQTPRKEVSVKIPQGSKNAQKIRLKGYGVQNRVSDIYGDLYLTLNVILPSVEEMDEDLRKILEERLP